MQILSVPALAIRSPFAPFTPGPEARQEAQADTVALSPVAHEGPSSCLGTGSKMALAGLAALALFGGIVASAQAAEPQQRPQTSVSTTVDRVARNPVVTRQVRRYISEMVVNNRVQSETLNTYQKSLQNNYNTLTRMEARIQQNPASLNDPVIRAVHEKAEAALDSITVYQDTVEDIQYTAATKTIELADGTRITMPMEPVKRIPRSSLDHSGAARMTDRVMEQIDRLLHPDGRPGS